MKVRDVEPKHISGYGDRLLRSEFKDHIELPCLEACLYLYDLNIKTITCNCHKDDPNVYLYFDYDSLSDENKEIANRLLADGILVFDKNNDGSKWLGICFEASLNDDVDEISNRLLNVAKSFQYQDVIGLAFYKELGEFYHECECEEEFFKLCQEFGITHSVNINKEGEILFDDEDYKKLEKNNHLNEFITNVSLLVGNQYGKLADAGMINKENGLIFVNEEIAKKHQEYLEKQKGKGLIK